jgi:hypothetical protein
MGGIDMNNDKITISEAVERLLEEKNKDLSLSDERVRGMLEQILKTCKEIESDFVSMFL